MPTTVEFVDIAGLVAGASQGEGLGNQFLAHIREVDAIAHVVRCFESTDVIHVAGKVDPLSDIDIINTELALADLATLEKGLERAVKAAKSGDKDARPPARRSSSASRRSSMPQSRCARSRSTEEERRELRELQLLTAKPVMYVANVAENGFRDNPLLAAVEERAAAEGAVMVAVCAAIEAEIAQLDEAERERVSRRARTRRAGAEPRDPRRLHAARPADLLHRGPEGGARLDGARRRHRAAGRRRRSIPTSSAASSAPRSSRSPTTSPAGAKPGAREAGKLRLEGKEYVVQEGDVMHFRFNV